MTQINKNNYTGMIVFALLIIFSFSCSDSAKNANQTANSEIIDTAHSDPVVLEKQLNTLRTFIKKRMEETKVPGLGLGIVKDGKVIIAEGFGTRDMNTGLPVDSKTIFLIGSTTKPFTTTVLAMLVDDGLVEWDAPVRTYLPTFAVNDDYVSAHITMKDLVTHRSGVPESEVRWMGSTLSRKEMVASMRKANLNAGFREKFQYNNTMFMAAGYVAGQVTNSIYEEVIHDKILRPLDMTMSAWTDFSEKNPPFKDNIAFPHTIEDGSAKRIEFEFEGPAIRPAGTLASNIDDMLKWVLFNLNQGKYSGKELLSEKGFKQLITPYMHLSDPDRYQNYGLGWYLETYHGHRVVHHGGSATGTITKVLFLPEDNIGIVAFTNSRSRLPSALAYYIVDLLAGNEPVDY